MLGMVPGRLQKPTTHRFGRCLLSEIHVIKTDLLGAPPNSWFRHRLIHVAPARFNNSQWANACSSAQDEKACCGLSPLAGLPITRTEITLTGCFNTQLKGWPECRCPALVAVVAG